MENCVAFFCLAGVMFVPCGSRKGRSDTTMALTRTTRYVLREFVSDGTLSSRRVGVFVGAMWSGHWGQVSFLAGMMLLIGLAHAISAMILRWQGQALVAALWWMGGFAVFFVPPGYRMGIFAAEMFFGFFCFGLYAMMLDRKTAATTVPRHG